MASSKKSKVKFAICQFDSHPAEAGSHDNTVKNFAKLKAFVKDAKAQQADVIVFPESVSLALSLI